MVRCKLILFLLVGCGAPQAEPVSSYEYRIETPEFQYYVDRFEKLSKDRRPQNITSLVMEYGDLSDHGIEACYSEDATTYCMMLLGRVVGLCSIKSNQSPRITIDRTYWEGATDVAKENLAFHELGHCILKRDHNDRKDQGVPVSLMFPNLIPFYYEKDKQPYINELFEVYGDWFSLTGESHICGDQHDDTDNEFCGAGLWYDEDDSFCEEPEKTKEEKNDLQEIITEVQKITIKDGEVLVVKVPKNYMTDPDFIHQMRYVMECAFGKDNVQSGRVMMVPDDIKFQKVEIKNKHPLYDD